MIRNMKYYNLLVRTKQYNKTLQKPWHYLQIVSRRTPDCISVKISLKQFPQEHAPRETPRKLMPFDPSKFLH